jgi:hypothetical protein
MHIQCLEEAELSADVLETEPSPLPPQIGTTRRAGMASLSTAASLALHLSARDEAGRMYVWRLGSPEAPGREFGHVSRGDERVAQLVRRYALGITMPEIGVAQAVESLRRGAGTCL